MRYQILIAPEICFVLCLLSIVDLSILAFNIPYLQTLNPYLSSFPEGVNPMFTFRLYLVDGAILDLVTIPIRSSSRLLATLSRDRHISPIRSPFDLMSLSKIRYAGSLPNTYTDENNHQASSCQLFSSNNNATLFLVQWLNDGA